MPCTVVNSDSLVAYRFSSVAPETSGRYPYAAAAITSSRAKRKAATSMRRQVNLRCGRFEKSGEGVRVSAVVLRTVMAISLVSTVGVRRPSARDHSVQDHLVQDDLVDASIAV